jgi:Tfp pilus assembly PilM family ATPase
MGFVGVDFGTRGIKMLQVCERGGEPEIVCAARVDVPLAHVPAPTKDKASTPGFDGESNAAMNAEPGSAPANSALGETIRSAFAAGGFTGRRCVIGLAREDVCVQSVRLPKMSDEELRQTAHWEAAQRFGFDRNAMQVDFIRTGATLASGENREEVILIAA